EVSGKQSIAVALGWQSKAKASINGAIVCVYRNHDGELIHIKASKVGENNIKADTWYTLDEYRCSLLRLKTTKKPYREPIYGSDRFVVEEHYYEDDA
ncbi:hypothetical protein CGSHi22121_01570, partial [Haemophilus influenzae 22.1-21]